MQESRSPSELSPSEHDPFYGQYIGLVHESSIFNALEDQIDELISTVAGCDAETANAVHPPYAWTIKEVIGHCIDNERVFGYRVSRIAAADPTPMLGYDQQQLVENRDYAPVPLMDLVEELVHLRRCNIAFLKRIRPACWDLVGTCDGKQISVRAIAFLFVGHLRHHLNIVAQRLSTAGQQPGGK